MTHPTPPSPAPLTAAERAAIAARLENASGVLFLEVWQDGAEDVAVLRRLLAHAEAQAAALRVAVTALEFYAELDNWRKPQPRSYEWEWGRDYDVDPPVAFEDEGGQARAALARLRAAEGE